MPSQMQTEVHQIPAAVERQLHEIGPRYREIGQRLNRQDFTMAISNARGTSDHAATYLKYLLETRRGTPVASVGPSVASVYGSRLRLHGQLCVTISQSGASRDLIMLQEAAANAGAATLAIVNDVTSPVAHQASLLAPMHAGPELAVAATKTYVASLVAIASIVAALDEDAGLADAIERLPEALAGALARDWSVAVDALAKAESVFTISRGPALTIAAEAALKLKETCRLHAEAYSAAEVRHGPIALAAPRFCALVFATRDEGRASILEAASALRCGGATVVVCDSAVGADLPSVAAPHLLLDPICQAVSFYQCVSALAQVRGLDADRPAHLSKVTVTV